MTEASFETFDILLIEDTASMRTIYESHLRRAGYRVISTGTAGEGLDLFRAHPVPVVLLDLMLPDRDGMDLLVDLIDLRPATSVVVVAAERSTERTVTAIRRGARDYLVKPVSEARLMEAVESASRAASLAHPPQSAPACTPLGEFIGQSAPMRAVYGQIRAAARSVAPVCIIGETGTGKELAALAIHRLSGRAQAPFVTFDCGAVAPERFEDEFFGHRRGAFAGAASDRLGVAEMADGGTLFLADICGLHPMAQARLARFLQTGLVHPLGAEAARRVSLRVLSSAATSLPEAVREGRLRADLFHRLHVVALHMPPLRTRTEDIPELAETFLRRCAALEGRSFQRISPEAMAALQAYPWPGNVRELGNVLRAVTVLHEGETLVPQMLPPQILAPEKQPTEIAAAARFDGCAGASLSPGPALPAEAATGPDPARQTLADLERAAIEAALSRYEGAVQRAAHDLGIAPSTLYRKLESWRRH